MMNISYRSLLKLALFFTLTLMALLGLGPLMVAKSAQFLGKDVSQVAAGILGFYPFVAVEEVFRILLVVFVVIFAMSWPWAALAFRLRNGLGRIVCFPVAPLVIYLLFSTGTVLKYPSFFSPFLPRIIQEGVYKLAFTAQPSWFWSCAAVLYLSSIAFLLCKCGGWLARGQSLRRPILWVVGSGVLISIMISLLWSEVHQKVEKSGLKDASHSPNILLIAVDSLRFDRLGRESVVPSLHKLLSDPHSVLFKDHYVGVPRTFPSWVELISGASAPQTGVRHMFPGFGVRSKEFAGFVSELRDSGYETRVWSDFAGDIFPRFLGGFEEIHTPNMTLKTMIRLSVDQSLPFFLPVLMSPPFRHFFAALKQSPAFADSHHLTSDVINQLQPADRPWLNVVFYSGAHFPYASPHPYYVRFTSPEYRGPFLFEKNPELGVGSGAISEEDKSQIRHLYDGAVSGVDQELGRLFESLRSRGLWDSTLIVVTADHGEDLYEHDRVQGHGEHLRGENVLKVPLIIKLPATKAPVRKDIDETTRSIDVGATILDICGIKRLIGQGSSLMPLMIRPVGHEDPRSAYSETGIWFSRSGDGFFQSQRLDYPGISRLLSFDQGYSGEVVLDPRFEKIVVTAKHRSLVFGDFKLIYVPTPAGVKYELYNRRSDPENLTDISKTDPVRLEDMRTRLLEMIRKLEKNVAILDDYVVPQ